MAAWLHWIWFGYIGFAKRNMDQMFGTRDLKDESGVKQIWDMFSMITSWNVRLGSKKRE